MQAYISDEGYDVDMFFEIEGHKGQIFSDVENERDEMINYLLINDQCVAKCIQQCESHWAQIHTDSLRLLAPHQSQLLGPFRQSSETLSEHCRKGTRISLY